MTEATAVTVAGAIDAYVKDRRARGEIGDLSADQIRWRLGTLARMVPDVTIGELSRDHLQAWQRTTGGWRPSTRRAHLSTVKTFVRWCLEEGLLEVDPTRSLGRVKEPRTVPRALSADQLARLHEVLPDLRAEVIVALMAREGLRCVEVSRLTVEDWDRHGQRLTVKGKADHERIIPLADDVAGLLEAWLADRPSGLVIGVTAPSISILVSKWMGEAGLKTGPYDGISAHALRHSAASDMYDRTRDVRAAQRLLGHANISITDRYLRHADLEDLRAALNAPPASRRARRRDRATVRPVVVPLRPRRQEAPSPQPAAPPDGRLAAAADRLKAAVAAEEEAERAVKAARAEREAATREVVAAGDGLAHITAEEVRHLYWETATPVSVIAVLVGLPATHKRRVISMAGPRKGPCEKCGDPRSLRSSRTDWTHCSTCTGHGHWHYD